MNSTANSPSSPWRLISLPISHYCEKVRWVLDQFGFSYVEEPHMLPFHRKVTQSFGGTTVPVLVTPEQILTDSSDIMPFLDQFLSADHSLYPKDAKTLQYLHQLENRLNTMLGPATRTWFYFYALDHRELLRHCWCNGVPDREIARFDKMLPKMKDLVTEQLELSRPSVKQSLSTIDQIFEEIESLLSEGHPYLLGNAITTVDITLSALASPILWPPEHPLQSTPKVQLPNPMMKVISTYRSSLAGQFILKMYRQDRHRPPEPSKSRQ